MKIWIQAREKAERIEYLYRWTGTAIKVDESTLNIADYLKRKFPNSRKILVHRNVLTLEISAVSEKEATNRIRGKIATLLGHNPNDAAQLIQLDTHDCERIFTKDDEVALKEVEDEAKNAAKPTCEECGTTLTDGGYCPYCDEDSGIPDDLYSAALITL